MIFMLTWHCPFICLIVGGGAKEVLNKVTVVIAAQ